MKKTIFNYITLSAVVLSLGLTSCEKDINEVNRINPNQFSDSDPTLMITGAQMANVLVQEGEMARIAGIFSGYFSGSDRQYVSLSQYICNAGDFDNVWGTVYSEGIGQCRLIKAKAEKANNKVLYGVASITEAHLLLTAASVWGDIPNTEACDDSKENPKFDDMNSVYQYCIDLLTKVESDVVGKNSYSKAYAGTFDWSEVANTLLARAYLHKKDYTNAKSAALKGVSAGNDLYADHSQASPGAWNLYYDFLDWNRPGYMSCVGAHIVGLLDTASKTTCRNNAKTDETGRFGYYFVKDYYTSCDPNLVDGIFATTQNFALVTYAETQLILAECESRLNNDAQALVHLNNVRAELNTKYGTYSNYVLSDFGPGQMLAGATQSEALLKEIMMEKYVSMYGQIEGWTDIRRTNNLIGVPANTGSDLPQRFLIPQSEINANSNAKGANSGSKPLMQKLPMFQ